MILDKILTDEKIKEEANIIEECLLNSDTVYGSAKSMVKEFPLNSRT